MKKIGIIIFCAIAVTISSTTAHAMLSRQKIDIIRQSCQEIGTDLRRVYGLDGLARTNLGQRYDNLQRRLMDPFIRRASSNGYTVERMRTISRQYATALTDFRKAYNQYHAVFDEVLSADCVNNPAYFYEKLEKMRSERAVVRDKVIILKELIAEFDRVVAAIEKKIDKGVR